jgi:Clostripain family
MQKFQRTRRAIGAIFLLLVCLSWSPEQPDGTEWTVMIFMNADNNLEPFALEDFAEIAAVGSTDKVNIIVQFDRSPGYTSDAEDWTQTLRFRVEKDMQPVPSSAIEDLGEVNMGDGKVLADFITWSIAHYPAKRYMLSIWDHGQGWRFERARNIRGTRAETARQVMLRREIREAAQVTDRTPALPLDRVVEGGVRYISSDASSGDDLYNREIQDTLLDNLEDRLDVIGFDACLMNMIETAYAMRGVARVMVGSEELEPGEGWQYDTWLEKLVANPTMDATSLGKVLVESYQARYDGPFSEETLSAIDLDRTERLTRAITLLADACQAKIDSELHNIRKARTGCKNYAPGYGLHGIDLGLLCDQLVSNTTDPVISARAKAVRRALDRMVIAKFAGPKRQSGFGSNGLAIYFPATKSQFDSDPDHDGYLETTTLFPVEFVRNHNWDSFLQVYFERVP